MLQYIRPLGCATFSLPPAPVPPHKPLPVQGSWVSWQKSMFPRSLALLCCIGHCEKMLMRTTSRENLFWLAVSEGSAPSTQAGNIIAIMVHGWGACSPHNRIFKGIPRVTYFLQLRGRALHPTLWRTFTKSAAADVYTDIYPTGVCVYVSVLMCVNERGSQTCMRSVFHSYSPPSLLRYGFSRNPGLGNLASTG